MERDEQRPLGDGGEHGRLELVSPSHATSRGFAMLGHASSGAYDDGLTCRTGPGLDSLQAAKPFRSVTTTCRPDSSTMSNAMEGLRERTRCHACRNCSGACWPNQMRQCFNVNQGSLRTRDLPVTRHVTSPSLHDGITDLGSRAGGAVRGGQGQPGAAKKGPGPRLRSRNERSCAERTLQAETHPAFCTEYGIHA